MERRYDIAQAPLEELDPNILRLGEDICDLVGSGASVSAAKLSLRWCVLVETVYNE